MYGGHDDEEYVETRIRLYKRQNKKTTLSLPPDPNSCLQAVLRANHQSFQWTRCLEENVEDIDMLKNGWDVRKDGMVVPVWFTCSQYPPSFTGMFY